jgi:hypothetical protein
MNFSTAYNLRAGITPGMIIVFIYKMRSAGKRINAVNGK